MSGPWEDFAQQDNPAPAKPMTMQDFTKAGQQSAIQEPTFQKLAGAVIPTAAAAASFHPAFAGPKLVAMVAQSLLSGGATAVNQALGMEPYSLGEIAKSTGIPMIANKVVQIGKGLGRGIGALMGPSITREAGVEAAAQRVGAPATSIARQGADKASSAAFKIARQQGDVPLQQVNDVIVSEWDRLTGLANAPTRATKYLENLSNKYAGKQATTYEDLIDELQNMRMNSKKAFAQKDSVTGSALRDARSKIIDEMDKVSPALKQANQIYRKEQATQEMIGELRKGNPGNRIRTLFENDDLVAGAFSKAERNDIVEIADKLASIGAQGSPYSGVTAKIFNTVADTLGGALSDETGRFLMRQTFKHGVTPQGIATVAQFWRAYEAQGGTQP